MTKWVDFFKERLFCGTGLMLPILMLVIGTPAARATVAMSWELRSPDGSVGVTVLVKLRYRVRVRVLV